MGKNYIYSTQDKIKKVCRNPDCAKELYLTTEFFGRNKRMNDGFDYYCRECRTAAGKSRATEGDGWSYVIDNVLYWTENLPIWSVYSLAEDRYMLNKEQVEMILDGEDEHKVKDSGEFYLRRNRSKVVGRNPQPDEIVDENTGD
ncbi:MAG: hypothetical protein HOE45_07020 [Gammaproteobacteria bacterium]|jgi:hypothetical protein|nr:hypothetical protein [Gammaproteobacteria bacterium]